MNGWIDEGREGGRGGRDTNTVTTTTTPHLVRRCPGRLCCNSVREEDLESSLVTEKKLGACAVDDAVGVATIDDRRSRVAGPCDCGIDTSVSPSPLRMRVLTMLLAPTVLPPSCRPPRSTATSSSGTNHTLSSTSMSDDDDAAPGPDDADTAPGDPGDDGADDDSDRPVDATVEAGTSKPKSVYSACRLDEPVAPSMRCTAALDAHSADSWLAAGRSTRRDHDGFKNITAPCNANQHRAIIRKEKRGTRQR
jgi:hypothetical protein